MIDHYAVAMKLIGPVHPIGDTRADDERFENLKALTDLTDALLAEITMVARAKTAHEYSVKRAGEFADKFLDQIGIPKE